MTTELTAINTPLDKTTIDIAGQVASSSQRIYINDARHFAAWVEGQGLTPSQLTRSEIIAYRSYLSGSTYAKATKQRMFSIACRLMEEQYRAGNIATNISDGI